MNQRTHTGTGQLTRGRPRTRRRAMLLVAVITCLTICMLLMGTLVRRMVTARRGSDRYVYALQSMLLADAGVQRAMAQLARDPSYTGESWEISATVLGQSQPASVQIRVQSLDNGAGARQIEVESQFPTDPQWRVVSHREFLVPDPLVPASLVPAPSGGES